MASTYNIRCDQRASLDLTATWIVQDEPVNLSGYSAEMQVRPHADSPHLLIELTDRNGRITLGDDGTVNMFISAEDTEKLEPGMYEYDLYLTPDNGKRLKLIEGTFHVKRSVTR